MSIVEIAKDYGILVNSIVLIVLLFKYLGDLRKQKLEYDKLELDLRKQKLEYEKLDRELQQLRARDEAERSEVLRATAQDIEKYVIGPLARELQERDMNLRKTELELMEQIRESRGLAQSVEREFHHDRERQCEIESRLAEQSEYLARTIERQIAVNQELLDRQVKANQILIEKLLQDWQRGEGRKPNKPIE